MVGSVVLVLCQRCLKLVVLVVLKTNAVTGMASVRARVQMWAFHIAATPLLGTLHLQGGSFFVRLVTQAVRIPG